MLNSYLHSLGFQTSQVDTSLLVKTTSIVCCYILIYIDDIIVMGSSSIALDELIKSLNSTFALKGLGKLNYFLDIEVSYPKKKETCFFLNLNTF